MSKSEVKSDIQPAVATTYSQVACIGAGFSAIGVGSSLKRWYGITDITFFERRESSGGTWLANNYPGCACDVPAALYSYSYEQNPRWTKLLPAQRELKSYLDTVADKYGVSQRMQFKVEVERFGWNDDAKRWTLFLKHLDSGVRTEHICQVLFNCGGALVAPNPAIFKGRESFKGHVFHSTQWRHDIDLTGKKVVVIGNGCTGVQIVATLSRQGQAAQITNIVRSKQWIYPSMDFEYSKFMQWVFRYVPGALQLHRLHIYLYAEQEYPTFRMDAIGNWLRESRRNAVENYMRSAAPVRYHDMLIPDFEIGCKRRIYDSGYLKALHDPRVQLTNSPLLEFVPEGVRTEDGIVPADIIVCANGFDIHGQLPRNKVVGRDGEDLVDHWAQYGGPSAYNGTAISGFPNLFFILGPNSGTGHTSAVLPMENQINQAMRVLKPVLLGSSDSVEISEQAEHNYVWKCQNALRTLVWHKGSCTSWFENSNKWNPALYPWSTTDFWRRCLFPVWSHWQYSTAQHPAASQSSTWSGMKWLAASILSLTMVGLGGSLALLYSRESPTWFTDAAYPFACLQALWKQLAGIQ